MSVRLPFPPFLQGRPTRCYETSRQINGRPVIQVVVFTGQQDEFTGHIFEIFESTDIWVLREIAQQSEPKYIPSRDRV